MSEDALDSLAQVEDLLHVIGEGNSLPLFYYHLKTVNGTFRERERKEGGEREGGGRERGKEREEWREWIMGQSHSITHKENENS